ncbi:NAD(P)-dependent oxidoreductase [Candidatus Saccharibacteria bacterium]|nr:MAG: NAD(P)-dependent oxidoreductase [Candidatus Saccharibacteria bacterium]
MQGAELIFEVTANDESAREVWLGEGGIVAHATTSQALITCATLSVEFVDELAKVCAEKGLTFLTCL